MCRIVSIVDVDKCIFCVKEQQKGHRVFPYDVIRHAGGVKQRNSGHVGGVKYIFEN